MTTAQVVEKSVTVNNSPIQDYVHPDDHTQPTYEMTPGFKPFTIQELQLKSSRSGMSPTTYLSTEITGFFFLKTAPK